MILYFVKTILLISIFYLLYIKFLKTNKSFKWNRLFLLLTSILSILLPFLQNISWFNEATMSHTIKPLSLAINTLNIYAAHIQKQELYFGKIVIAIYSVGFLFGFGRFILGLIVINKIKNSSRLEHIDNDLIYFNQNIESPFSFNKNIYIPINLKNHDVIDTIIAHEKAHIQLKHSRDKIYFSLLQALFWFNPFVYYYHKEIELVHEFEADEISTKEIPIDDYVSFFLQTISYAQLPTLLAHDFFQHPIKIRIAMLYKKTKGGIERN